MKARKLSADQAASFASLRFLAAKAEFKVVPPAETRLVSVLHSVLCFQIQTCEGGEVLKASGLRV